MNSVVLLALGLLCATPAKPTGKLPYQIKNEKLDALRGGAAAAVAAKDFDRGVSLIQEALALDDGKRLRVREAMKLADSLSSAGERTRAVRLCDYLTTRPNVTPEDRVGAYLKASELCRKEKDFAEATAWAEKAFAANARAKGRTFHCTSALVDSLRNWKGPDATLDRLEGIVRDWEDFLPEKDDLTSILSAYCLLAYRNLRFARVERGLAEHERLGVKFGAHIYRSKMMMKELADLRGFPRAEESIRFPRALADFGVADTNTVHAKDFGWNADNATACLQKAMDTGATTVVLDDMGAPWRISCVTNRSNQRLLFRKGARILADRHTQEHDRKGVDVFRVWNCSNVIFEGEGDNSIGKWETYEERRKWNKKYGSCGLDLKAADHVSVRNLRIAECSMDAICLSGSEPYNTEVFLEDCTLESCYRQAMSICGADGVYCRNVKFLNTRGGAPMAGIDLEPAIECFPNTGIYLYDCTFEGNGGGGFVFYTSTYAPMTVHLKRCTFAPNGPTPVEVFARCGIYMNAGVKAPAKALIEDCDLVTYADTPALNLQGSSLFDVTLRNCRLRENGQKRNRHGRVRASPIRFSLNREFGPDGIPAHMVGKVRFENVTADGWKGAPLVKFADEFGMLDVKGVFEGEVVFNGRKTDAAAFTHEAPDLRLKKLELPDLAALPPPTRKVAADEVYRSNMSLSWNGAWFQSRPTYQILYWAEAGRVVRIDDVALTNATTGWHAYLPPHQKDGWSFKTMTGARPVYMSDTTGNSLAKYVLKDVSRGYTGYFLVPGKAKLRVSWGGLDVRNAAGELAGSVRQDDYDGRHVFDLEPHSGHPEVWSFTTPPGGRTRVMRFHAPLSGYWADDPADLPGFATADSWRGLAAAVAKEESAWDDARLANDIDWTFLDEKTAREVRLRAEFRRAWAEKGSGAAALRAELDKIADIRRNATTEANLRDANEELKNLPPLERRADLEKRVLDETPEVRKLAAYFELRFESLSEADRERGGLELVDGHLDYRNVKGLKDLL